MNLTTNQHEAEPVAATRAAADAVRGHARFLRAGFLGALLLGVCVLAAGCGTKPSDQAVATLGQTTTTTGSSSVGGGKHVNPSLNALAFVGCMRTHGDPSMADPSVTRNGHNTSVDINVGSGIDPSSPQFAAAYKACKHVLPSGGVPSAGPTITSADRADYLEAAACMRSHGVPDFPDPSFENNNVEFTTRTPIDTNSSEYKSALATCQKLIPAGLPYSSSAP